MKNQSGSALIELAFSMSVLTILSFGVFETVSALEAYRSISAAAYESARMAGVDPHLSAGSFSNLEDSSSCNSPDSTDACTGHVRFQNRLRWLTALYNGGNGFSKIENLSGVSTSLVLKISSGSYSGNLANLSESARDVVTANIGAALSGILRHLPIALDTKIWTPYLYERKVLPSPPPVYTWPILNIPSSANKYVHDLNMNDFTEIAGMQGSDNPYANAINFSMQGTTINSFIQNEIEFSDTDIAITH